MSDSLKTPIHWPSLVVGLVVGFFCGFVFVAIYVNVGATWLNWCFGG